MPRKGAATAAPAPAPEVTKETEVVGEDLPGPGAEPDDAVPARPKRGGRSKEAEAPEGGYEDWTEPDYAHDPGEFEFDSLDDEDEYLTILWWGREGTGKTTDLARVASTKLIEFGETKGDILLINAEGGAKRTPLQHHGIDTSRIRTYPKRGQQLTFEGLERLFYRLQADLEKDPDAWAAVGWDSITAIYQKLLDDVIEADMRKQAEILQRARKTRAGRSGNITLRDRFENDRDDFAAMSNQMRLLLRKYRTLSTHFLVTALERRDEDKADRKDKKVKVVTYGPAITPALQVDLLGYVDLVIRTHVLDDGTYYGRTTPTEDARGKDRMFSLPVELVDPTFDRILGYVRGSLKEQTDKAQQRMPGGAEGVRIRRTLDDDYSDLPYDPPTDEPVEEADKPDPPKRTGRTRAASSGRSTASAKPSATEEPVASEPESAAPESASVAEPPKASGRSGTGGRRSRSTSKPSAEPSGESTAGTETKTPARRSGRKTPADRATSAAREQVKAETEGTKSGPATRAAAERARKANEAVGTGPDGGFTDEPPF